MKFKVIQGHRSWCQSKAHMSHSHEISDNRSLDDTFIQSSKPMNVGCLFMLSEGMLGFAALRHCICMEEILQVLCKHSKCHYHHVSQLCLQHDFAFV